MPLLKVGHRMTHESQTAELEGGSVVRKLTAVSEDLAEFPMPTLVSLHLFVTTVPKGLMPSDICGTCIHTVHIHS